MAREKKLLNSPRKHGIYKHIHPTEWLDPANTHRTLHPAVPVGRVLGETRY